MHPLSLEYLEQRFTTCITDSSEQELKRNGRLILVDGCNKEEFIYLAKSAYIQSFLPQLQKILHHQN